MSKVCALRCWGSIWLLLGLIILTFVGFWGIILHYFIDPVIRKNTALVSENEGNWNNIPGQLKIDI